MQSIIGHRINHFRKIQSTHTYMTELVSKTNPANGIVISADFQTTGVGQFGRNWLSESDKNILLSFYVQPGTMDFGQSIQMHFMTTLAIIDVLEKYSIQGITTKWPNDIRVNKSKIAGILMRTSVRAMKIHDFVISIGLNVNQICFRDIIGQRCTSFGLELSKSVDRLSVFWELLDFLNLRYAQFCSNPDSMKAEYLEYLEEARDPVKVILNEKETFVRVVDFDKIGRIGLKKDLIESISYHPHNELQIIRE